MIDLDYDLIMDVEDLALSYYNYERILSEVKIVNVVNDFGTLRVHVKVNEIGKVEKDVFLKISIDEGF